MYELKHRWNELSLYRYMNGIKELDSILLELPSKVKARRQADIETELNRLMQCYEKNVSEFSGTEPVTGNLNSKVPNLEEEDTDMSADRDNNDARTVSSQIHGEHIQERIAAIHQRAGSS